MELFLIVALLFIVLYRIFRFRSVQRYGTFVEGEINSDTIVYEHNIVHNRITKILISPIDTDITFTLNKEYKIDARNGYVDYFYDYDTFRETIFKLSDWEKVKNDYYRIEFEYEF